MAAVGIESSSILTHSWRQFSDKQKNAGEWQTLARTSSTLTRKSRGVTMSGIDKTNKFSNYSRVFTTNNPLYESKEVGSHNLYMIVA